MVLGIVCGGAMLFLALQYQHTSSVRPEDCYADRIPQLHSTVDADGDGIDDQVDILKGALD